MNRKKKFLFLRFLGSGPKGPMSCRTQGGISRRPSVLPSCCPSPPRWPSRPHICPPSPQFSPLGLKSAFQALNQPSRLQISPPRASNLTSRSQICPLYLQLALQASNGSNFTSKPQIFSPSFNSALQPSNMLSVA